MFGFILTVTNKEIETSYPVTAKVTNPKTFFVLYRCLVADLVNFNKQLMTFIKEVNY